MTICSRKDADIQEIIDDNNLEVASIDEEYNIKIIQDTLKDFCFYTYKQGIATESKVRKFMKAFQKDRLPELDVLLSEGDSTGE